MKELDQFIESNPDSRELKRALAVRMTLQGYSHREIMKILQVCSGFISKWKEQYSRILNYPHQFVFGLNRAVLILTPHVR